MKTGLIALTMVLLSGWMVACSKLTASKSDVAQAESANWKVTILSATRGPRPVSPGMYVPPESQDTGTYLNVEIAVEYKGSEKTAPIQTVEVSVGGKALRSVGFLGNIMERMQSKKFNETHSFEDPGPEPSSTPRQFTLKYADVQPINFTLMAKKPTNVNP